MRRLDLNEAGDTKTVCARASAEAQRRKGKHRDPGFSEGAPVEEIVDMEKLPASHQWADAFEKTFKTTHPTIMREMPRTAGASIPCLKTRHETSTTKAEPRPDQMA